MLHVLRDLSRPELQQFVKASALRPLGMAKGASRAKWRSAKSLQVLWDRLGIQKDPFSGFGEVGLARSRQQVADALQGKKPNRMAATVDRLLVRLKPEQPPDLRDGDVLFRGINPTEKVTDLFHGGGYWGGAVRHASPRREVARGFGDVTGTGRVMNVTATYKKHPQQTYGGNYAIEELLENGYTRGLTHNPLAYNTFETAITPAHNPALGVLVRGTGDAGFIGADKTKSIKDLGNFLSEVGKRSGPPQTKYMLQGGLTPIDPDRATAALFRWQPGTPEASSDFDSWLSMLGSRLRADPNSSRMLKKFPVTLPGFAEKSASISSLLRRALNQTHTHPTEAQIEAGNYRKGEFPWQGLTIKIENPEGTTRSGTSKSGRKWSTVLKHSYGYFRGTKGRDGDPVDVFIGPDLESGKVAVIDQHIDGKFDEHKAVIGVKTEEQARDVYLANYQKGWKCGPVTLMSVDEFKTWLKDGDTRKPVEKAAAGRIPAAQLYARLQQAGVKATPEFLEQILQRATRLSAAKHLTPDGADRTVRQMRVFGGASYPQARRLFNTSKTVSALTGGARMPDKSLHQMISDVYEYARTLPPG